MAIKIDALDAALLSALATDPRTPILELASRLKVARNTVQARMKRLATAKDLTPAEQNAKRAIGVLMKTVVAKRTEEGLTGAVAPDAVRQAGEQIRGAVQGAAQNRADAP